MVNEPEGFREFVVARSPALLRTAWMLTGDAAAAEDLLQTALARTWPHWDRVVGGAPDAYVRKVMTRTQATWRLRKWTGETPTAQLVPTGSSGNEQARVDERMVLAAALGSLPIRQRQAVVLRYFDDLSVEAVAEIMGSSPGTVKSQCSKGLSKLRCVLSEVEQIEMEQS